MIIQIVLTLSLMLGYFLLFYKVGSAISKVLGRRVCITCYSVSLTWITLLILKYTGIFEVSTTLISILIAQSAVGISNLSDEFLIINNLHLSQTILKFGTIVYGTFVAFIFGYLSEIFGFILVIPLMWLGILSMTPINYASKPVTNRSKELMDKLKKCCG
jgi:hypothetical protein